MNNCPQCGAVGVLFPTGESVCPGCMPTASGWVKVGDRAPFSRPEPERIKVSEPPIGYRAWRLHDLGDGPILMSTTLDYTWDGPVAANKQAPGFEITEWGQVADGPLSATGFSVMKAHRLVPYYTGVCVSGEVDMLGTVIEHELGYRAQGVRIRKLWVHPGGWRPARARVSTNGTDTCLHVEKPEDATEYGAVYFSILDFETPEYRDVGLVWARDAPPPWREYGTEPTDVIRALESRYHCDVEYTDVPINIRQQVPEIAWWDEEDDDVIGGIEEREPLVTVHKSIDGLHTPTKEEVERYG